MDRRAFLGTLGLLATPRHADAQPAGKVWRIAFLMTTLPLAPAGQEPSFAPLYERLKELGWMQGRDFVIERRAYGDRLDRIPGLATDLIRTGVDVFVVTGAADAIRVQEVTHTIPIVAWGAGDLVEAGAAISLTTPGRNVTGIQTLQPELASKHLSLLKEIIPRVSRVGYLFRPSTLSPKGQTPQLGGSDVAVLRNAETGGKALGIALQIVTVHEADELAFDAFKTQRAQAVVIVRNQFMGLHLKTLADLAMKNRLPTISDMSTLPAQGGLIFYGFDIRDTLRSTAGIIDKILRGARVSEIPIQQATTF